MNIVRPAITGSIVAALLAACALGADVAALDPSQPTSIRQIAFEYDSYLYFAPQAEPSESPSDVMAPRPLEEQSPAAEQACEAVCDSCCSACCSCPRRSCCSTCLGDWLAQLHNAVWQAFHTHRRCCK